MKKLIYVTLMLVTIIITSCSKEVRINRKLDGEWRVTSITPQVYTTNPEMYFTFEKDGKKGKGTYTYTVGSQSETYDFDYTLSGDKLTLTPTTGSEAGDTEILTITKYESKKIEFTVDALEGVTYVLEPK
jgi:hypothetical protein